MISRTALRSFWRPTSNDAVSRDVAKRSWQHPGTLPGGVAGVQQRRVRQHTQVHHRRYPAGWRQLVVGLTGFIGTPSPVEATTTPMQTASRAVAAPGLPSRIIALITATPMLIGAGNRPYRCRFRCPGRRTARHGHSRTRPGSHYCSRVLREFISRSLSAGGAPGGGSGGGGIVRGSTRRSLAATIGAVRDEKMALLEPSLGGRIISG